MKVYLPANCTVRTVADVLGRLLGCAVTRKVIDRNMVGREVVNPWYADVRGVFVDASQAVPECAHIRIVTRDTEPVRRFLYHFEFGSTGERGFILDETVENLALAKALVRFFGGRLVCFEGGDPQEFRIADKSNIENHPDDGAPFQRLQERIEVLRLLSPDDRAEAEAALGTAERVP